MLLSCMRFFSLSSLLLLFLPCHSNHPLPGDYERERRELAPGFLSLLPQTEDHCGGIVRFITSSIALK